jgi:hypothetical protein
MEPRGLGRLSKSLPEARREAQREQIEALEGIRDEIRDLLMNQWIWSD